jgi:hypothetical protein
MKYHDPRLIGATVHDREGRAWKLEAALSEGAGYRWEAAYKATSDGGEIQPYFRTMRALKAYFVDVPELN